MIGKGCDKDFRENRERGGGGGVNEKQFVHRRVLDSYALLVLQRQSAREPNPGGEAAPAGERSPHPLWLSSSLEKQS